jgi:LysM repeat protein
MNRDEENDRELRGSPADEKVVRKPGASSGIDGRDNQPRPPFRPQTRARTSTLQAASAEPWVPATLPRRGPSHPDWEKPPTQYDYPVLRGREARRTTMWPIVAAALAAFLVIGVLVIIPTLMGHGGTAAVASGTAKPHASGPVVSGSTGPSASVSLPPGVTPSPTAVINYIQYKVVQGDSLIKIQNKCGVSRADLIAANPQLTPPNYPIRINQILNLPDTALPVCATGGTPTPTPTVAPTPTPSPVAP